MMRTTNKGAVLVLYAVYLYGSSAGGKHSGSNTKGGPILGSSGAGRTSSEEPSDE